MGVGIPADMEIEKIQENEDSSYDSDDDSSEDWLSDDDKEEIYQSYEAWPTIQELRECADETPATAQEVLEIGLNCRTDYSRKVYKNILENPTVGGVNLLKIIYTLSLIQGFDEPGSVDDFLHFHAFGCHRYYSHCPRIPEILKEKGYNPCNNIVEWEGIINHSSNYFAMGIDIWCGDVQYRGSYTSYMYLRYMACIATKNYLINLITTKTPEERAKFIISLKEETIQEILEKDGTEIISRTIRAVLNMTEERTNGAIRGIRDNEAGYMLWARHQIFADLQISGLVDFVFHSDTDGYFTFGMAIDILAWWDRVKSFFPQAVKEFLDDSPTMDDLQKNLDSISKKLCPDKRIIVEEDTNYDFISDYIERMDKMIAVFRKVVEKKSYAVVC